VSLKKYEFLEVDFMKFIRTGMVLVDLEERKTKTGESLFTAVLADKATYESIEVSLNWGHDMAHVAKNRDYNVEFKVKPSGYDFSIRATLAPTNKA
jgi:hypothetical protein